VKVEPQMVEEDEEEKEPSSKELPPINKVVFKETPKHRRENEPVRPKVGFSPLCASPSTYLQNLTFL